MGHKLCFVISINMYYIFIFSSAALGQKGEATVMQSILIIEIKDGTMEVRDT